MNNEAKWDASAPIVMTSTLKDVKPNHTINFFFGESEIGILDFNGPQLKFTGDAEESAKRFIEWAFHLFDQRLKDERTAERQRCIALLEGLHEAQSKNQNHNYYAYAANLLKEQT